jgi:hypothetical protein
MCVKGALSEAKLQLDPNAFAVPPNFSNLSNARFPST